MKKWWILGFILALGIGLRFYRLGEVPHGLAFDEAGITYNAWSIALWHRDEFAQFMPLSFRSFGDYKPPLLIYALAAGFFVFGLHLTLIRVYSAFFGVGVIVVTYLITQELMQLFPYFKKRLRLLSSWWPYLSALFVAVSPWAVHFSRLGFEQNLAVFLSALGIWCLLKGRRALPYVFLGSFFMVASLYTFHTAKVFVPILGICSLFWWSSSLIHSWKRLITPGLMAVVLLIPLAYSSVSGHAAVRAGTLIAFTPEGRLASSIQIGTEFVDNVFNQLSPAFWVGGWDAVSIRHSVPGVGVMYGVTFMFLLVGLGAGFFRRDGLIGFLTAWLVAGLFPALVSHTTPHALRSLMAMIPAEALAAYGVLFSAGFWQQKGVRTAFLSVVGILVSAHLFWYMSVYYGRYTRASAEAFQYGYAEAFAATDRLRDNDSSIVVTDAYGQPYVYALLYHRITPQQFQFGALNQYQFRPIHWPEGKPHTLYIATPAEIPPDDPAVVDRVVVPGSNQIVLVVAKT